MTNPPPTWGVRWQIVGMDEQVARTIQDAFLQLAKWRAKQLTSLKVLCSLFVDV
jgi:hypothetical protein